MNVIQRYLFRRIFGSFIIAFPALSISIWMSQALRELNLVTDRGQGIGVFIEASILLIPGLVVIIGPVTMLIVVISTINTLNNDSELVSLGASGGSPGVMLKPVLALAIPVALLSASCSLFLNPMSARASVSLIESVSANVISSLIRPGQFRNLGNDIVIQVAEIHPDGSLEGIFVFDQRLPDETVAYLAGAGAMFRNDAGQFLLMQDGVIQRRQIETGSVSVIRFDSYAFDLSTLASQSAVGGGGPNERRLAYLLNPDPSDPIYQDNPFRYLAEFHSRMTIPLYVIVLALLPLAMLGQVQTARRGRGGMTAIAAIVGATALGAGLYLAGPLEANSGLLVVVYGIPLVGIAVPILLILSGRRIPSFSIVASLRATGLLRRRREAEL